VLTLKRSILTEKVARRGFHVTREYSVGTLDALFVRDVVSTEPLTLDPAHPLEHVYSLVESRSNLRHQRLLPVVRGDELVGVLPWTDVLERAAQGRLDGTVADLMRNNVVVAYPDENLRTVAERMAEKKVGVVPVVERGTTRRLRGLLTQFDLLAARERDILEERHRERVLRPRLLPRSRGTDEETIGAR
jgi:CBS domain-containing protein